MFDIELSSQHRILLRIVKIFLLASAPEHLYASVSVNDFLYFIALFISFNPFYLYATPNA